MSAQSVISITFHFRSAYGSMGNEGEVSGMQRMCCIVCGDRIMKSGLSDPYICRTCEHDTEMLRVNRFEYLDNI